MESVLHPSLEPNLIKFPAPVLNEGQPDQERMDQTYFEYRYEAASPQIATFRGIVLATAVGAVSWACLIRFASNIFRHF